LSDVAAEVSSEADVLVDGGIRGGLDVLAALALGARAVFVARPAVWALAVGGATAVARLLATIEQELVEAMRLAGVSDVREVPADLVFRPS
jgi:4-hydroxymandelate oxidase